MESLLEGTAFENNWINWGMGSTAGSAVTARAGAGTLSKAASGPLAVAGVFYGAGSFLSGKYARLKALNTCKRMHCQDLYKAPCVCKVAVGTGDICWSETHVEVYFG